MDSLILNNNYFDSLNAWFQSIPKYDLLYRGSRDGFKGPECHSKIDNYDSVLCVIETVNGNVFGGYTSDHFDTLNKNGCAVRSSHVWLFSLKNPHNVSPLCFKDDSGNQMIFSVREYGPCFGEHGALCVRNESNNNTMSNTINFEFDFKDTTGYGSKLFDGAETFQIKEIEVFHVKL
ncbi:hypothetical protein WA158_008352 [Blastocystis sp. Blastoise]